MQVEFLDLVLASMMVDKYENRFSTLIRYDLKTISDEQHRAKRFLSVLRLAIRDRLFNFRILEFGDAFARNKK